MPYRIHQTRAVGSVQARARLLLEPHPPGICPGEAPSVGASGDPVVKLLAVTPQHPRIDLQRLSSRSRTHLCSAPSTCSPCLSEFGIGFPMLTSPLITFRRFRRLKLQICFFKCYIVFDPKAQIEVSCRSLPCVSS